MKRVILLASFVGLLTAWTSAASEQRTDGDAEAGVEAPTGEETNFAFGDSCEKLGELSWEALASLTTAANAGQGRERFCAVDYPEDCFDFSIYVEEFGSLYPGHSGYCRFSMPMRLEPRPAAAG